METYDVIVVGAGPAGTTAARICALHSLKTLLLEKEKLPREKPCAGGLSVGALRELDFDLPGEVIMKKCYGIYAEKGMIKNTFVSDSLVAVMTKRDVFDAFLAEKAKKAGALLRENDFCKGIRILKDHVIVYTSSRQYKASIVIGADGFFSKVRKAFCPPFRNKEICHCLVAEVPMNEEEIVKKTGNLVQLYYGYNNVGYGWVFPKREYISFGMGGDINDAKSLKKYFLQFLHDKGINTDAVKIKGCFIPITRFYNNIYTNRVMLAGDAAGLVDCFSGEGIRYALASGKIAAETATDAIEKNDFSIKTMKKYQSRIYKKFKADFIWSRRVALISFRFPDVIFGTPLRDEAVIRGYVSVLSGDTSFKTFSLWVLKKLPGMMIKRFLFDSK